MRDPGDWDGGSSDRLLTHALDVTDPASIRSAFHAGVARFGVSIRKCCDGGRGGSRG
jgi:hypothetical protein